MTFILDNELIKKYFVGHPTDKIGERILIAMEAPIKKGEQCLSYHMQGYWIKSILNQPMAGFHPYCLRLPDAFQDKDPMEEKIRQIIYSVAEHGNMALEGQLRELVKLAIETDHKTVMLSGDQITK